MDFQALYQQKLTTADEAVKVIKSGMWVHYGYCLGAPVALDKALARRADELTDVNIHCGTLLHRPAIADVPEAYKHFSWNSIHMTGFERKMIKEGLAFYLPIRYSEVPSWCRKGFMQHEVAMIQVAPMDKHGWFNCGPSASHVRAVCETAKIVILEVNNQMPICLGGHDTCLHISEVDMVVEGENQPLDQLPASGAPSDVDYAVAKMVVSEIPNGACLQLGIGTMPSTIGKMIAESDLKDLGVHTEMYVDAFVEMSEAGRITGACKPFDRGRQVYAFAAGSKKLYDFLDNNPECCSVPVDYANDVARISEIDNFISINGTVDVDLYGQVSAESTGTTHISGSGGQQDFVLGAYLSNGGKSFICCSSTVQDKKTGELKSRIRPTLVEGSVVTSTRTNLHYLVTEYGMFNAKGKTTWERAEGIINLAHPQFRDELIAEAEKMHIWRRSNKK